MSREPRTCTEGNQVRRGEESRKRKGRSGQRICSLKRKKKKKKSELMLIEHVLCAGCCSKHFVRFHSSGPHNRPMEGGLWLSPFSR